MEEAQRIARNHFNFCVGTNQYWAVVDGQSDLKGWTEEYWDPDHSVALTDNIIFGKVEIQVRKVNEIEWEEEGATPKLMLHPIHVIGIAELATRYPDTTSTCESVGATVT
jgi:hypothetical protein